MGRPKKEKPNRADGLYEIKVTVGKNVNGGPIRKSFYSSVSKEDARKQAEKYKIEKEVARQTNTPFLNGEVNFSKWADKWLNTIRGTVKDNTYSYTYEYPIEKHLKPYFGKVNLSEIKTSDITTFFNKKAAKYSYKTLKAIKNVLNALFEAAINDDLIPKNPCNAVKLKNSGPKFQKQIYTDEQVKLVIDYAQTHRYGLEIIMLLTYGLRRGELLGLQWNDIDYENKVIHLQRAVADVKNSTTGKMEVTTDVPKTAYSVRDLPMPDFILEALKARPRSIIIGENKRKQKAGESIETEYIFYNSKGEVCSPRTWSRRHYDMFMEEMHQYYAELDPPVDVPIRNPHELRHTRASLWVNEGKNIFAIASIMGWGDLKMLRERYAHPDVESARKALF